MKSKDAYSKVLDPRLRRLINTSQVDPERLRTDLHNFVVQSAREFGAAETIPPDAVTKRVLVRTRDDEPPEIRDGRAVRIVDRVYSVDVPVDRLEQLASQTNVEYMEAGRILTTRLESSVPETRADLVHGSVPGANGKGVVVGIIDFGMDFTLDDFRDASGKTRIRFLWDQSMTPVAGEVSPARFGYGVEYDAAAINKALDEADPFSGVRHRPPPESHGTHVAGTAVGNGRSQDAAFPGGRFIGTAPEADIVFVQPAANDQHSTFTDSVHVAEAISYIFEKAEQLEAACVINMSLGQNGGSHDGESVVERAIDRLLEQPGRAFTVAAGNEHVWRGHAGGELAQGDVRRLHWKVGGGLPVPGGTLPAGVDRTPNEMEIWYSSRDQLRVRVIDPDGQSTLAVNPGETEVHTFPSGNQAFVDSERFSVLNGDARVYIEISSGGAAPLTSGTWIVEVEAIEVQQGRFDAWIERDARDSDNAFADQSFFQGTDFDAVRTIGTPATTRRGIAVANYDHRALQPSNSSGRGTTRDGGRKPEVAAPGTAIVSSASMGGRNVAGVGVVPMRTTMSGTSMAAPHVAGIAALLLERNDRLTSAQVRAILIASARPPGASTDWDEAWGYGRVDAQAAVALLES